MNSLINGIGYDQADLMIIGDYARKADESAHHCLSGYYKQKLEDYLKPSDFSINQTYRTCIIKNYVKGLGVGTYKQDKSILEACFEIHELEPLSFYIETIIDEINIIKPAVIICMGEFTLRTLTGKESISEQRGSVLPLAPDIVGRLTVPWGANIKVLASYHISIVHTQEELHYIIKQDFKKAVELVFQPNRQIDYHEVLIAKSSIDFLRFIDLYPLEQYKDMAYDIETHRGFITCAGISFDGYRGMSIPLWGNRVYSEVETARNLYLLSQLLAERSLINQNINYDRRISQRYGLHLLNIIWDTMLAEHTLVPEFPKNLGFLTSIYTDMSYYKDEGHDFDPRKESYDVLYGYNAKDAISTFQIYKKQVEDLKDMELYEFFTDFVMKLFHFYFDLEHVGLRLNFGMRDKLNNKYEGLKTLKELELKAITKIDINLSSPTQIGKYLEAQGFPVLRHRVASGFMVVNTDVDSLKKMRIADPIEYRKCQLPYEMAIRFINLVLLVRRIDKIIEYVNVGPHPNGRIHTSVNLGGTTSGRTSGGKTVDQYPVYIENNKGEKKLKWEKLGQSFQTVTKHGFIVEGEDGEVEEGIEEGIIGKDVREMYEVDKGWVLVEGDGSQAEARVCDVLGEDWASLEEYGKVDKHCKTAAAIFTNYTYEEIFKMAKKEKSDKGIEMRNIGKHSKHAKNNGMEAYLFAQKYIPISNFREALKQAKLILDRIDRAYPNIEKVFHKQVEEILRSTRTLVAPHAFGVACGRKRLFLKKIDKHYLNVAYSFLPQAAISDHTKASALRIFNQVDRAKALPVGENHDSLTSLVKKDYLRTYVKIAKAELERPIDFRGCSLSRDYQLVIPAEFSIGRKTWGKMKEIKHLKN